MAQLLAEQRRRLILEKTREHGAVKTSELSRLFSVSVITIRKDLHELAEQGKVMRTHGGAVTQPGLAFEPTYQEKVERHAEEKGRIGQAAANLVEGNMAIFIGNGSTTMEIVKRLDPTQHVTVFTNALTHAMRLSEFPHVDLWVIGGHLRWKSYAMVGPLAERSLEGIHFDRVFLGVDGVSLEGGVTIPSLDEAETAREILLRGQEAVIVADHSKFGKITHGKIADLASLNVVMTDGGLDACYREALRESDVELHIV